MLSLLTLALAALQTTPAPPPRTALPLREFMSACVQSGGDLGWFTVIPDGQSVVRGVYLTSDGPAARVTVSFFNEDGSGVARVFWFNASNTEITQALGIPESFTVVSKRVRYAITSTGSPTAVCTRVR